MWILPASKGVMHQECEREDLSPGSPGIHSANGTVSWGVQEGHVVRWEKGCAGLGTLGQCV